MRVVCAKLTALWDGVHTTCYGSCPLSTILRDMSHTNKNEFRNATADDGGNVFSYTEHPVVCTLSLHYCDTDDPEFDNGDFLGEFCITMQPIQRKKRGIEMQMLPWGTVKRVMKRLVEALHLCDDITLHGYCRIFKNFTRTLNSRRCIWSYSGENWRIG